MIKTSDFFKSDTLDLAKKFVIRHVEYYGFGDDFSKKMSEAEQNEDLQRKIRALIDLGTQFIRNHVKVDEIPVGVGLLLKAIDLYDQNEFEGLHNEWLDDDYFHAKAFLSVVFLPKIPFLNDIMKNRIGDAVAEDGQFGLTMLLDLIHSGKAKANDFLSLSLMYATGTVVERNMDLARDYYAKAIEVDSKEHPDLEDEFKEFYSQILSSSYRVDEALTRK